MLLQRQNPLQPTNSYSLVPSLSNLVASSSSCLKSANPSLVNCIIAIGPILRACINWRRFAAQGIASPFPSLCFVELEIVAAPFIGLPVHGRLRCSRCGRVQRLCACMCSLRGHRSNLRARLQCLRARLSCLRARLRNLHRWLACATVAAKLGLGFGEREETERK